MQHHGEIIKKAIDESGYNKTRLAEKLGVSRGWIYQICGKDKVPVHHIVRIGKAIHHDFFDEIKILKEYKQSTVPRGWDDPMGEFMTDAEKAEYWKDKYLQLLEERNEEKTK